MPFLDVKAMWVYCSISFKVLSSTCEGGTPFCYEASSPLKMAKRSAILVSFGSFRWNTDSVYINRAGQCSVQYHGLYKYIRHACW